MLFAKVIIYYNMAMKYAEKHNKRPGKRVCLVGALVKGFLER